MRFKSTLLITALSVSGAAVADMSCPDEVVCHKASGCVAVGPSSIPWNINQSVHHAEGVYLFSTAVANDSVTGDSAYCYYSQADHYETYYPFQENPKIDEYTVLAESGGTSAYHSATGNWHALPNFEKTKDCINKGNAGACAYKTA